MTGGKSQWSLVEGKELREGGRETFARAHHAERGLLHGPGGATEWHLGSGVGLVSDGTPPGRSTSQKGG